MGAGSTSNATSGSATVTQGVELLTSGNMKEISVLKSNQSVSDSISQLAAAKNDFKKAKTTFESIKTNNPTEKQAIRDLILLPEYYIPKMDFIVVNNLGITYITDGLIGIVNGDYTAAKKNYTAAQSVFSGLEKNRAEMEKKAMKINQSVWDQIIPNHEKLTYIKTNLAASDKDWMGFSQAMSDLCDAMIAKKSGDTKKTTKLLNSSVTRLKVLKDSPSVGVQASEWYGLLSNQSIKIDFNKQQLSQANNNLVFPTLMKQLEYINTQIVTQLASDDNNLDNVQFQGWGFLSWSDTAIQCYTPSVLSGIQYVLVVNKFSGNNNPPWPVGPTQTAIPFQPGMKMTLGGMTPPAIIQTTPYPTWPDFPNVHFLTPLPTNPNIPVTPMASGLFN